MNKKQFTAVLQVVLWLNDDMKLEQVRKLFLDNEIISEEIIQAGIKLHEYLNSIKIKWQKYTQKNDA